MSHWVRAAQAAVCDPGSPVQARIVLSPSAGDLMPRCRPHGSWTPLRGPAPPKDPGGTAQESVSAQGGTHPTPPCTQDPTRHPGPGKQARRHLLTLSRRWQLPQEVHHATLDPVRNHGTLIESRAAFRIPAQAGRYAVLPGSRNGSRTCTLIRKAFPVTSRTLSTTCRFPQCFPHAILDPKWLGPVGFASIPCDLERHDRVAYRSQGLNDRTIGRRLPWQ